MKTYRLKAKAPNSLSVETQLPGRIEPFRVSAEDWPYSTEDRAEQAFLDGQEHLTSTPPRKQKTDQEDS